MKKQSTEITARLQPSRQEAALLNGARCGDYPNDDDLESDWGAYSSAATAVLTQMHSS
jgi:hypothetical protein